MGIHPCDAAVLVMDNSNAYLVAVGRAIEAFCIWHARINADGPATRDRDDSNQLWLIDRGARLLQDGRVWSNRAAIWPARAYWPFLISGGERIPVWCPSCIFTEVLSPPFTQNIWVAFQCSLLAEHSRASGQRTQYEGSKGSACSGELRIKGSEYNNFISFHSWKDVPPVTEG